MSNTNTVQNPCRDVKPDPILLPLPGQGGGELPPLPPLPGGSIQPPEPPQPQSAPFPEPFDEIDDPVIPGPEAPRNPIPPRPPYASAIREVTVAPSNCFIILGPDSEFVNNSLGNYRDDVIDSPIYELGQRPRVNNGSIWLSSHPEQVKAKADVFRWCIGSVWYNNANNEAFARKSMGPSNSPWDPTPSNQNYTSDIWRRPIFVRKNKDPLANDIPSSKRYYNIKKSIMVGGEQRYNETIRIGLQNPENGHNLNYKRFSNYDDFTAFLPKSLASSGLDWKKNLRIFNEILFFGDQATKWQDFLDTQPSQEDRQHYAKGLFKFGFQHVDYAFDAPVAFFEKEMNNMLVSPFHSAKIESNIGNVDFVNLKGYESELEVPNVYHYYNSLDLKKDWETGEMGLQSPAVERLRDLIGINNILKAYSSEEKEHKYATREVLKFPSDRVKNLEEINEVMKKYAENYVEININTSQKGFINSILQRNKMDRLLLEVLAPPSGFTTWKQGMTTYRNYGKNETSSQVLDDSFKRIDNPQNSVERTLNDRAVNNIPLKIKDAFLDVVRELPNQENDGLQSTKLEEYPLLHTGWNNKALLRLEESIKSQIFLSQVEDYISKNKLQRAYADILNGQKCYSEAIGYKIEKHSISDDKEELIQTFYLMDSNEIDRIQFLDSQILPGKQYKYKIFTINFVIATEYLHLRNKTKIYSTPGLDLGVQSWKAVYLIDAPFFEQTIDTYDKSPLPPQVNFLPYQGVDDKFGILLTTNYGEIKEPRIRIFQNAVKEAKEKMVFKTDSLPSHFYGIRIEEEPESYSDFASSPTRQNFLVQANSNAGFTLQNVQPNKYYYYFFRTFDRYDPEIGGHPNPNGLWFFPKSSEDHPWLVSNPGEVFRVRMVSYQNGIFMEMEPYEMYRKPTEAKVDFEKVLKISPNFEQKAIDFSNVFTELKSSVSIKNNSLNRLRQDLGLLEESSNQYIADSFEFQKSSPTIEKVRLGIKKEQKDLIWSKNFKIRIKSKTTGKAIDLNIKFEQDSKTITNDKI